MKKLKKVYLAVILLFTLFSFLSLGCNLFKSNPVNPPSVDISKKTNIIKNVNFQIRLPSKNNNLQLNRSSILSNTISTPKVIFTLDLINPKDFIQPITQLKLIVAVTATGSAHATFNNVPSLTAIGKIEIIGGSIASYTEFRGATDLTEASNTIVIAPIGSGLPEDIIAETVEKISASSTLLINAPRELCAKIASILASIPDGILDLYSEVENNYIYSSNIPKIELISPTMGDDFSNLQSFDIIASVSSSDIERVSFYNKTTLLGESSMAPYTIMGNFSATGTYTIYAKAITKMGAVGYSDIIKILISQSPPIANAGIDLVRFTNETVNLSGSASNINVGEISYLWAFESKPAGSIAVISNSNQSNGTFMPDLPGEYQLSLVVSSYKLSSVKDYVKVSVTAKPIANAGANQIVDVTSTATLNASLSSDADGDALVYQWEVLSKPDSSIAKLSNTTNVSPHIIIDVVGEYEIRLTVSDGKNTSSDTVLISGKTEVGGIISTDTVWLKSKSPYYITNVIQQAYGTTLTIEPGVKVIGNGSTIEIFGVLSAIGTLEDKIIFDHVNIAEGDNASSEPCLINISFAEINYCTILKPGNIGYGSFNIRNCLIKGMSEYMYIWYPTADCYIEKNIFVRCGGLSIGTHSNVNVYIKNNVFVNNTSFDIQSWATYSPAELVVEKNSFLDVDKRCVVLKAGYTPARITAIGNYWNSIETSVIDQMIYDKNDDLTCADYISYTPFLTEPDPETPDPTPYL